MGEEAVTAVTAVAVEVGDETSTEDIRLPETETAAETASANLHLDVTLTPTYQLAIVAAAVHLDLHAAPVLHPDPQIHRHHLAETAMNHATDDANVAPVPQATQYLPSDAAAEEREGEAVRITVIVLNKDPSPAAVPRAHVPPEDTAADKAPSPAVCLARDPAAHLHAMPAATLAA